MKQKIKNWFEHVLALSGLTFIIGLFFRHWFKKGIITSGDWGFFWSETMRDFWPGWQLWDSGFNFGRVLDQFFLQFSIMGWFVQFWDKGYAFSERVVWFFPLLFFAIISAYALIYTVTHKKIAAFFGGLLYTLNTYSLLIAVGGQVSVGIAIAIAPLPLLFLIRANQTGKWHHQIAGALFLSLQALYDLRITYVTGLMMTTYLIINVLVRQKPVGIITRFRHCVKHSWWLFASFLIMQAVWLWPLIQGSGASLPEGLDNAEWIKQLSFITMNNGLTLAHPLWPLRMHGLIQYPDAFFYFNIIVVFLATFFWRKKIQWYHAFFLIIILINAFIVKGLQEPFGAWYVWAFEHVPGFVMFRDPSKFYTPIVLGVALYFGLFMDAVINRSKDLAKKLSTRKLFQKLFQLTVFTLGIGLVTSQTGPALIGEVGGTFETKEVPLEYTQLKNFITGQQSEFFRTFWLPEKQRFAFFDNQHPIINNLEVGHKLQEATGIDDLAFLSCNYYATIINEPTMAITGAKYLIIPQDTEHEFSYKVKQCSNRQIEGILARQPWLEKKAVTKHIKIFENKNYLPRFYGSDIPIIAYNSKAIVDDLATLDKKIADQPTIINFKETSEEQKKFLQTVPAHIAIQYNAEDPENIIHNRGWTSPSNKMDTRANITPEANITYRFTIPQEGIYALYANLRHDHSRGTLQYVYNLKNPNSLRSDTISTVANWSSGLQPSVEPNAPVNNFYYANKKLGEDNLSAGENIITFRNTAPYAGDPGRIEEYGSMTIDYFWLFKQENQSFEVPITRWQKITNTHYEVQVSGAQEPFWLNFLENYQTGWKAQIDGQTLDEQNHFASNIYAQSWYVEKTGNYTMDIIYQPQEYLEQGLFVSMAMVIISIVLFIAFYVATRNKKTN